MEFPRTTKIGPKKNPVISKLTQNIPMEASNSGNNDIYLVKYPHIQLIKHLQQHRWEYSATLLEPMTAEAHSCNHFIMRSKSIDPWFHFKYLVN